MSAPGIARLLFYLFTLKGQAIFRSIQREIDAVNITVLMSVMAAPMKISFHFDKLQL